jgi:protein-disulfide isomerase
VAKVVEFCASIATLVVAGLVVVVLARNTWVRPSAVGAAAAAADATPSKVVAVSGQLRGTGKAAIAIVEFSDFQCPYCGSYARDTFPAVAASLVDSGRADYYFRHLPLDQLHSRAVEAATAAECAGEQGRFWEMHDRLFADQSALSAAHALDAAAHAVGLDGDRFRSCLKGPSRVQRDKDEALQLGITATPTFLIGIRQADGRLQIVQTLSGAAPADAIVAAVESAAKRAAASPN